MPDKHELKGKAKEMIGKAEKKFGESTGDDRHVASGESRQMEGHGEQKLGGAKRKAKDFIDKI